jgi:hypothetical protein
MLQQVAVFAIVALASVYAVWKLMPRALRARLAHAMLGWAQRRGRLSGENVAALEQRLTASGCGSCDSCGNCGTGPAAASDESVVRFVQDAAQGERVPQR